jgi:hypothetical protein
MTVTEFLPDYCRAIELLLEHKKGYHTFGPICVGIEFLGKCLDDEPVFNSSEIEGRDSFNRAICELMPSYTTMNIKYNFYGRIRNGMLHSLLPKKNIWFREIHSMTENDKHLHVRKINGVDGLVLVANYFYEDFKSACDEVIKRIANGAIVTKKVTEDFLSTTE